MKKSLLFLGTFAVALNAFSQITLTQNDLPTINTHIVVVLDTVPVVSEGSAGASQTWDFTALNNNGIDTTKFVDPATTLYASSFPNANIASYDASSDTAVAYFSESASAFELMGFGSPTNPFNSDPFIVKLTPPEELIALPSSYSQTFSGVTGFNLAFPYVIYGSDSIRIIQKTHYAYEMDAWGTLTTPYEAYDALRQRFLEHNYDTIAVHLPFIGWTTVTTTEDSTLTYRWFANSVGLPVVTMSMDPTFTTPTRVSYVKTTSLSISEPSLLITSAFPNPANDIVTIRNENGNISDLELINPFGQTVKTQKVTTGTVTISVAELSPGMYSIVLRNKQGRTEGVSRITVEH